MTQGFLTLGTAGLLRPDGTHTAGDNTDITVENGLKVVDVSAPEDRAQIRKIVEDSRA